MRHYTDKDVERRYPEPLKQSQHDNPDGRGARAGRGHGARSAAKRRKSRNCMVPGTPSHGSGRWGPNPDRRFGKLKSYHVGAPVLASDEAREAAGGATVPYETSERNAL